MGAENTGTLLDYSFISWRIFKMCYEIFGNFYKCFFYYLLDLISKILYLPIMLGLWIGYTFLGIDGYSIEKMYGKVSKHLTNSFILCLDFILYISKKY